MRGRCALCGAPNPPEALYCGNCGSRLAAAGPQASAATAVRREERVRVSTFSATVGLFLLGLIVSGFAFGFHRYNLYNVRYFLLALAGTGGGLALALWLAHRLAWEGRGLAAGGMLLLTLAGVVYMVMLVVAWSDGAVPVPIVVGGLTGLGIGLLFPVAFWQHLAGVSPGRRAALVIGAIMGLALGWWTLRGNFFGITSLLAAAFALLVGLPSVLVAPIVRRSLR